MDLSYVRPPTSRDHPTDSGTRSGRRNRAPDDGETMQTINEAADSYRYERRPTKLERALRSSDASAVALLIFVPAVSWTWIVVMANDMYGPMSGASAWMMTSTWTVSHLFLLWAMWTVMMAGMMLPSASPTLLLSGVV